MNIKPYLKEQLLCKNKKYLFCYDKGFLILRKCSDKKIVQKLRIHNPIKSMFLVERLLRYELRTAVALSEQSFLYSDHGYIYRYSVIDNNIEIEHKFSQGMNNPLSFSPRYDGNKLVDLLYGEYIWNKTKGPVSIYRRTDGKWNKVFSFPADTISHIHNIFFDKFKNRYIILTGDEDSESGIWEADINFEYVRPIIIGLQKYRACIAYPTKDAIYYATDTPLEQNYLFKLTESNGEKHLKKIYKMPGPCIFGKVSNDILYMATSVEGNPQLGSWRYRLSNKLGEGVKDKYTHIIAYSNKNIIEIGKMKKDIFPMWLFQFGNAKFPISDDGKIYICPQSCVCDYNTYVIEDGKSG